ncbi:helix-turn-helix transcriptional regulator [Chitinophaga sp. sic0106]|uniref:helix-turn-helix transcriptional regulator n=1 Tax=Chitinophaga sp. sic0106 TaxID=2854785 RepID=UPI001C44BFC4|nr:helix-turn-helix transcriptional regulator [Chitinophaga sp. sic0106]MBV7532158.1 helix-turn-helix domain-containing protein [Chitinophaga sp. sic0106]
MNNIKLEKLISKTPSDWKEKAQQRMGEKSWKRKSRAVAITVLSQLSAKGITQTDLAERMGVSRQQISKIVKGQENLTLETIDKLEQALGITIIKILAGHTETYQAKIPLPTSLIIPQVLICMPLFSSKRKQKEAVIEVPDNSTYMSFTA